MIKSIPIKIFSEIETFSNKCLVKTFIQRGDNDKELFWYSSSQPDKCKFVKALLEGECCHYYAEEITFNMMDEWYNSSDRFPESAIMAMDKFYKHCNFDSSIFHALKRRYPAYNDMLKDWCKSREVDYEELRKTFYPEELKYITEAEKEAI